MQEPTHEESNNMKMEIERRCVENQTGHTGEELPQRTFCRAEALHRAVGHQGGSLQKSGLLQKRSSKSPAHWGTRELWTGEREKQAGGDEMSPDEIQEEPEKTAPGSRAAAGRWFQPPLTKWTSIKQNKEISQAAVVRSQSCLEFVQVGFSGGGTAKQAKSGKHPARLKEQNDQTVTRAECLLSFIGKTCLQHFYASKKRNKKQFATFFRCNIY